MSCLHENTLVWLSVVWLLPVKGLKILFIISLIGIFVFLCKVVQPIWLGFALASELDSDLFHVSFPCYQQPGHTFPGEPGVLEYDVNSTDSRRKTTDSNHGQIS